MTHLPFASMWGELRSEKEFGGKKHTHVAGSDFTGEEDRGMEAEREVNVMIEAPAQRGWLSFLDACVCQALLTMTGVNDIQLCFAVREALLNAIQISEKTCGDIPCKVMVQVTLQAENIEILVQDEGPGLQVGWREELNRRGMEDRLLCDSGRGLLFICEFVDEVWSDRGANGFHIFGMRKRRGSSHEAGVQ